MHSYNKAVGNNGYQPGRLNPCFNGRCTRTVFCYKKLGMFYNKVLILVLMEDALALVQAVVVASQYGS